MRKSDIILRPATRERWDDLATVFGKHGAYSGCWCMYWRVKRADFDAMGPAKRKAGMKRMVARKRPPGILFYDASRKSEPVPFGWCSLGPREGQHSGMLAYMGIAEVSRALGFREIARRRDDRPVIRLAL